MMWFRPICQTGISGYPGAGVYRGAIEEVFKRSKTKLAPTPYDRYLETPSERRHHRRFSVCQECMSMAQDGDSVQKGSDEESSQRQKRSGVTVGIAVLIWRGAQVLLTKRKGSHGAGTWAPPGGHLDMGESFEDCAIREVREETGVTISEPRFLAVTNDVFVDEGKHYATIWMEAQVEA